MWLLGQLGETEGAAVSFSQWVGACFFRVYGSSLHGSQEFLMLERLAVGARTPLKVLETEFCAGPGCRVSKQQRHYLHIRVLFVSTWNFYSGKDDCPTVYLKIGARLYHLRDLAAFYRQYVVRESALHPWETEAGLRVRLAAQYPQLEIPNNFLNSLKRCCFETDSTYRLVFFLAHSYVEADALKSFRGLVKAGTWGGGGENSDHQVVIVSFGTPTLRFLFLAPGAVRLSDYRPGKTGMQQKHLDPENLTHLLEPESFPAPPRDKGSPSQCPCEFGELLTQNLPPSQLSRPVGYSEASADLGSNLQVLGLTTPLLSQILDVCTWLSVVCYDVERYSYTHTHTHILKFIIFTVCRSWLIRSVLSFRPVLPCNWPTNLVRIFPTTSAGSSFLF